MLRISLNGGEVSPKMQGRCDLPIYQSSAVECKNFVVDIEGGIRRRSGFEFCGYAKYSTGVVRVLPFRYSVADQLVLEIGFRYIRFWRDNQLLVDLNGDVYELETPWLGDSTLTSLRIEQVNDVMLFAGSGAPPMVLERFGKLDWRLRRMEFRCGPWEDASKNKGNVKYKLLSATDPLVSLSSQNQIFSKGMAYGDEMIRLKLSRLDASYALWSSLIWRISILPGNAFLNSRGDIPVLSSAIIRAGEQFTQYHPTSYYLFTCLKDFHGSVDAVLGEDARNYPEFFMPGINAGKDYRGRISEAWSVLPFDSTKRTTFYAGSTVKIEGLSDGLAYYSCIKDFKYWLKKDGGDVDPQWTKPRDISSRYIDFLTHINYHYFPLFPFEVCGGWELTTEGVWNADWEIRRSYDKFSVHKKISDYHWDTIKSFSQSEAGERKNYSLSGVEEESCLLGIFCTRTSELGLGGIGKSTFKTLACSIDLNVTIEEYISPTNVNGRIENWGICYDAIGASTEWAFGAFGSKNGYPRGVVIHQGRLWFGGTRTQPTGLWGSASDDFYNFRVGGNDGDAVSVSLNGGEQSGIAWLSSARHLLVGTEGSEWLVSGGQDGIIKPSTIDARIQSRVGSLGGHICDTYTGVCFVGRNGKQMWDMKYSWETESWSSRDLTKYASHLFNGLSAEKIEFMKGVCDLVFVLTDGHLMSCSMSADDGVQAWARHYLGGEAEIKDICVSGNQLGESVLNVVARIGGKTCILRWRDESDCFVDYWTSSQIENAPAPAQYLSRYKTTRFESPDSASSKRGAVQLSLDVDSSVCDGVCVGIGSSLQKFVYKSSVIDGWEQAGVSGDWRNGLSVEVEAASEHGFSLRGMMLSMQ